MGETLSKISDKKKAGNEPGSVQGAQSAVSTTTANQLLLGDEVPDFEADTTEGHISFHQWLGTGWGLLFSHPADFTPVCTTELSTAARLNAAGEFQRRDVKIIGISCDSLESHHAWSKDIGAEGGHAGLNFPLIADPDTRIARLLGMLHGDKNLAGLPMTVRTVFIIGPDKKLKLSLTYPASTGRNFNELVRVIDSLQLTAQQKLATPADWKVGEPGVVLPSVSDEDAKKNFPNFNKVDLPSGKGYLRYTDKKPQA